MTNPISWVRSHAPTLIDNWRTELHRLWSIRVSLFYGIFAGTAAVLCAFVPVINPWLLLGVSIVVNVALIPLARLVKQADPPQPVVVVPPATREAAQ